MRRTLLPTAKTMTTTAKTTTAAQLTTSTRTVVMSNHVSPALEQVAITRGFQAPLWLDINTIRRNQTLRQAHIVARPGERPTMVSVQNKAALFNIDQLRAGPRGLEFLRTLPAGVRDPTDASSLQPFRGALGQQLEAIAAHNKWGPFWISSAEMRWKQFFHVASTSLTPPAWRTTTVQHFVLNFDQLTANGLDLSTVPVNYRYNTLMFGNHLAEQLRNEALRRDIKYPVVATSKVIEISGCTLLPEHVAGFSPEESNGYNSTAGRWRRGGMIFNLDEFEGGSEMIEKQLMLQPAKEPTFAFSGQIITRQIVLEDRKSGGSNNNNGGAYEEEQLADYAPQSSASQQQQQQKEIPEDENGIPQYRSNYWLREYEARQLSDNKWKLRINARGALLGDSLVRFSRGGRFGSNGGAGDEVDSSLMQNQQQQQQQQQSSSPFFGGGGSDSMALGGSDSALGGNGSQDPYQQQQPLPRFARMSDVPRLTQLRDHIATQNSALAAGTGEHGKFRMSPYYFDRDVKEREMFLSGLGTFNF